MTGPYRPAFSAEEAGRIRRWHEDDHREALAEAARSRRFHQLGLNLEVPPLVQPPSERSHLLGEAVLAETLPGDRVLDLGTGCGVNALLAASRGGLVLAVDANPHALTAAEDNADRNDLAERVEVRHGDVFDGIDTRFDLIVFASPVHWFPPRDWLESATTDEDYRNLTNFFTDLPHHLAPAGRVLLSFASTGDLAYLRRLVARAGLTETIVASGSRMRDGQRVEHFTFLLRTRRG